MFNKKIFILLIILAGLIGSIIYVSQANKFKPPAFDSSAKSFDKVPNEKKVLKVNGDYAFYIDGNPYVKDDYIYVSFYSLAKDNIYLKVRVIQDKNVIAESGLLKSNEFVEKVKLKKSLSNNKSISYLIMSYEKDTYYSMGEVTLNVKLEDKR